MLTRLCLLVLACVISIAIGQSDRKQSDTKLITIKTAYGKIEIELYSSKAPETVKNFLRYIKAGAYEGGVFHRTVTMGNQPDKRIKIEVIQGGPKPKNKDFAPINLERTNETGVNHVDGAISMARDGANTATSDFFILVGGQP